MRDDLVKRHVEALRLTGGDLGDLCQPIADAIEALTAEREALEQDNHRWKMECENFWRDREKALTAERDKYESAWMTAEGKLADVEAERDRLRKELEAIANDYEAGYPLSHDAIKYVARAALKGESHE